MPFITDPQASTGTLKVRYADGGLEGFHVIAGALRADETSAVYASADVPGQSIEIRTAHIARLTWTPDPA